jgi:hypothetical protein
MLKKFLHGIASVFFFAVCAFPLVSAQQSPIPAPTIRVQSSLVLIDLITQDRKTGLPIRDFKKEDFRVFDNGHKVPITTFDAGAQYDTRAITLWLVVICNERGLPTLGASAEFLGEESLFRPALNHLERHDSVGVAHWCDNGDSRLDLLPTEDRDKGVQALAETLQPIPFEGGTSASDEAGEQAELLPGSKRGCFSGRHEPGCCTFDNHAAAAHVDT